MFFLRKALSFVLMIALAAGAGAPLRQPAEVFAAGPAQAGAFTDVLPGAWYYQYVLDAAALGIAEGYGDGSFKPEKTLTYGEFITMTVEHRASEAEPESDHWAWPYYAKALELGYFTESDISARRLAMEIPRKDMALILCGKLDAEAGASYSPAVMSYTDVSSDDPYEYCISRCSSAGLLEGYEDGSFRPDKSLKRCEAVKVCVMAETLIARGPAVPENNWYLGAETTPEPQGPDRPVEELMPAGKRQILEYIAASLRFTREGGALYYSYDQPDIPDEYHLRVECQIYDTKANDYKELFSHRNDSSWKFHPENYDSSAHHEKQKVTGVSNLEGKSMNFVIRIFDTEDLEVYSNISIYLEEDGSMFMRKTTSDRQAHFSENYVVPEGIWEW